MVLRSRTNPYPGINIHLNSFLQSEKGDWVSFHSSHIEHLRIHIDQRLPDNYFAVSELGLQIGGFDAGTGWESKSRVRPDITITERETPSTMKPSVSSETSSPTGTLTLLDSLRDPDELIGLTIYYMAETHEHGQPIARIELLSPANKIGGAYHNEYSKKRRETLETGLQLIEIDYLHASRPVIRNLASYRDKQKNAYPYVVLINDPRPTLEDGWIRYFAWHVEDKLPVFPILLRDGEQVIIDLGYAYNYTYENVRVFQSMLDYAVAPINIDTYTEADQQKIQSILADIRERLGNT